MPLATHTALKNGGRRAVQGRIFSQPLDCYFAVQGDFKWEGRKCPEDGVHSNRRGIVFAPATPRCLAGVLVQRTA